MRHLLALDLGTTTCRCLIFREDGSVVSEAYRETRMIHEQAGWAESDPAEWWAHTRAVIREALAAGGVEPGSVAAIGLTGMMHAIVPVGADGIPRARAMLWLDQRCQPQCTWLTREHEALLMEAHGTSRVTTTMSAPKLRWWVEHRPDVIEHTATFLLPKDVLRLHLTGVVATDPSDASGTLLYSSPHAEWYWPLVEAVGLRREQFPPILSSEHVAGSVTRAAAAATGLQEGTPVVTGGSDVHCTLLGALHGVQDRATLYLGTAAWMITGPQDIRHKGQPSRFGSTATSGAALRWCRDLFGPQSNGGSEGPSSYLRVAQLASASPPGARGLLFLPHLMGERGMQADPLARGVLYGLTLAHQQPDIYRAVLEGTAYQLRKICEQIGLQNGADVMMVGGGARGELWPRVIADITGHRILLPKVPEAAALGAAALAQVGAGFVDHVAAAAVKMVHVRDVIEPDEQVADLYQRSYSAFCELEERVTPLYHRRGWPDAASG